MNIEVYTLAELKEKFPSSYTKVLKKWQNNVEYIPWMDETCESLKKVFEYSGIKSIDWSLGAYSESYVKFAMNPEVRDLHGQRAIAWLENNLLGDLRIPWTGNKRKELAKYGENYRPGMVKPCPFTGYYADEVYLEKLQEFILDGYTLSAAYTRLAKVCGKLLDEEYDYAISEESLLETALANDYMYTSKGQQIY